MASCKTTWNSPGDGEIQGHMHNLMHQCFHAAGLVWSWAVELSGASHCACAPCSPTCNNGNDLGKRDLQDREARACLPQARCQAQAPLILPSSLDNGELQNNIELAWSKSTMGHAICVCNARCKCLSEQDSKPLPSPRCARTQPLSMERT